jgi:sugar-specific transcriptional regulator TrmB
MSLSILEFIEDRERAYQDRIYELEAENKQLRKELNDSLMQAINHGNAMLNNLVGAIIDPPLKDK